VAVQVAVATHVTWIELCPMRRDSFSIAIPAAAEIEA